MPKLTHEELMRLKTALATARETGLDETNFLIRNAQRTIEESMREYTVVWRIELTAESAEEAAREAQKIQRDLEGWAGVFDVYDKKGCGERIDLDGLGGTLRCAVTS